MQQVKRQTAIQKIGQSNLTPIYLAVLIKCHQQSVGAYAGNKTGNESGATFVFKMRPSDKWPEPPGNLTRPPQCFYEFPNKKTET
jgi:hypothetical protein